MESRIELDPKVDLDITQVEPSLIIINKYQTYSTRRTSTKIPIAANILSIKLKESIMIKFSIEHSTIKLVESFQLHVILIRGIDQSFDQKDTSHVSN